MQIIEQGIDGSCSYIAWTAGQTNSPLNAEYDSASSDGKTLYREIPRDPRWDTKEGREELARHVGWLEYKHGVLNPLARRLAEKDAQRNG